METVDIIIIGAGVVGLAVASEVSREGQDVLILERRHSWGQETSSRNSEVIHAGIYYHPGSLKALACYEGRNMLYSLCPEHGIGIKKTGKLIIALDQAEIEEIKILQKTAEANGVKLDFIEADRLKIMEPHIRAQAALYSPETGIVDSHALMKYFHHKAQAKGADIVCEAHVTMVSRQTDGRYLVEVDNQGEKISLSCRIVINCAGEYADKIARMCGIDIVQEGYEQYYLKGSYFRLADKYRNKTQHLIYPVPDKNSLGIHTVLDLSGGIRLGPDAEEVTDLDYNVSIEKKDAFYESAKKFLPSIEKEDLFPDTAGIRPQLRNPNQGGFRDFIIRNEADRGLPGLINLIGIESPGLTASPFLGKYVREIVEAI